MEELRAALAQPCFQRLVEALDACDAIGLPKEELADAKQEFRARQQRYREELRGEDALDACDAKGLPEEELVRYCEGSTEMREWTTQEKRKHKAASKGCGAGADSKGGARRVERLGFFREIRHPKE